MPTLYIDFETYISDDLNLDEMLLRKYLDATHVTGVAWKEDDDDTDYIDPEDPQFPDFLQYLRECAADPSYIFVAHNAGFDMRVLKYVVGSPWPHTIDCSMELAMAVWPNQVGGYSLGNLSTLYTPYPKLEIDFATCTPEELRTYAKRDVDAGYHLYATELDRIGHQELAVQRLAQCARDIELRIDHSRAEELRRAFITVITENAETVAGVLDDVGQAYGRNDDGSIRSVRSQNLRQHLKEKFGFTGSTTSLKKLNPALLNCEEVSEVLHAVSKSNKMLWHLRNALKFLEADVVDVEWGYARAHTFRFSSPQPRGKGINLHNQPKRDPQLAKPIRSTFRLPQEFVWVAADLQSLEYRWNVAQTACVHGCELFDADINADAYIAFWKAFTGQDILKSSPARALSKNAVLGLGFLMGLARWMAEIMKAVADPNSGLTDQDLIDLAEEQRWRVPNDRWVREQQQRAFAPDHIAAVAYHTLEAFHNVHPEFRQLARWLERVCDEYSRALNPTRRLAQLKALRIAPDPRWIDIIEDPYLDGRSLRVRCGDWEPTLSWRDIKHRMIKGEPRLTSVRSGQRGYRALTKNILIENVTQAGGRNAGVKGQLALRERFNYDRQFGIHDEMKLRVPKDADCIREARQALIDVYGPGNSLGYGWACQIDPTEIEVSSTLYGWIPPADWWDAPDLTLIP